MNIQIKRKKMDIPIIISREEASKAIELLDKKEYEGRTLTVNEARPMEARPPRRDFNGGGNRGGYGSRNSY